MKWIFSTLFHIIIDFVNKPKMGPFRLKCYLYYHYRLYIVVLKIRRQWRNKPVNNKRRGGTSNKRIRKEITNKKHRPRRKLIKLQRIALHSKSSVFTTLSHSLSKPEPGHQTEWNYINCWQQKLMVKFRCSPFSREKATRSIKKSSQAHNQY